MITPKNKELSKLVLWKDRGNTVLYKIENNTLLFSHNLDEGGITFDIEDMQEVDFDLVGSEIDYKPILKKLGLNDEEVNQFMKKKNKISNDTIDKLTDIYVKWGEDNNIKDPTSADEVILRDDINNEQRKWLESFIENWNIAEDLDRYIHREEKQDEHNT
tara:strand:+ start:229 stop:708 length:480 start_codon:yes stop_codon:yes gene_type:complete